MNADNPKGCYWTARRFSEPATDDDYRPPWYRDYGRVVHSASFRRLQAKTQILGIGAGGGAGCGNRLRGIDEKGGVAAGDGFLHPTAGSATAGDEQGEARTGQGQGQNAGDHGCLFGAMRSAWDSRRHPVHPAGLCHPRTDHMPRPHTLRDSPIRQCPE